MVERGSRQVRRFGMVGALNREWSALAEGCRSTRERVSFWAGRHAVFASCLDVGDILAVIEHRGDIALTALIGECSSGDALAGRVVLQSMIGRVVQMSRRDPAGLVDDYVTALWRVIVTYPLDRRPTRVAANLALDTLKLIVSERRRPSEAGVALDVSAIESDHRWPPAGLDGAPAEACLDLRGADVIGRACGLGLLDASGEQLLRGVYLEGWSGREAAGQLGLTPAAVRRRCSRTLHRLRDAASELAVA